MHSFLYFSATLLTMKQTAVLNISIPSPCSQNWEAMPGIGGEKHCSQCNNIVFDYSQMDDDELLQFLKGRSVIPCGRFHRSQLCRDILSAPERKNILARFNRIAAALFTVLSFKSLSSKADIKHKPLSFFDSMYRNKLFIDSSRLITGIVKDENGKPLENAQVKLDDRLITVTDNSGRFSFKLEDENVKAHKLYFSYDKLMTAVRTYYPAMMSTNYEVALLSHGTLQVQYLTGVPVASIIRVDFPSVQFGSGISSLTPGNIKMLAGIATKMREYPEIEIKLSVYPASAAFRVQDISNHRVDNIKRYLVEKEKISTTRIRIVNEIAAGAPDMVDVTQILN